MKPVMNRDLLWLARDNEWIWVAVREALKMKNPKETSERKSYSSHSKPECGKDRRNNGKGGGPRLRCTCGSLGAAVCIERRAVQYWDDRRR